MKVQVTELDGRVILRVEGRLSGVFVPELEGCWEAARAKRPGARISLDLRNVTCVDRAGRGLLRRMQSGGVEFHDAGLATQDILAQLAD